jgi:hypothetical protein
MAFRYWQYARRDGKSDDRSFAAAGKALGLPVKPVPVAQSIAVARAEAAE